MAIRQIRTIGDEILTKECKPVKEMNERTLELIEDMFETMYENNGVGLAPLKLELNFYIKTNITQTWLHKIVHIHIIVT